MHKYYRVLSITARLSVNTCTSRGSARTAQTQTCSSGGEWRSSCECPLLNEEFNVWMESLLRIRKRSEQASALLWTTHRSIWGNISGKIRKFWKKKTERLVHRSLSFSAKPSSPEGKNAAKVEFCWGFVHLGKEKPTKRIVSPHLLLTS